MVAGFDLRAAGRLYDFEGANVGADCCTAAQLVPAAETRLKKTPAIAAVNRCATQNSRATITGYWAATAVGFTEVEAAMPNGVRTPVMVLRVKTESVDDSLLTT